MKNHWFTYDEHMSVESVTQAVSNVALAFGDDDTEPSAMVGLQPCCMFNCLLFADDVVTIRSIDNLRW